MAFIFFRDDEIKLIMLKFKVRNREKDFGVWVTRFRTFFRRELHFSNI